MSIAGEARTPSRLDRGLKAAGDWLMRNHATVRRLQWGVVLVYVVLIALPAFVSLPPRQAHIWTSLTLFAQFAFWGLWWPFVLVSMALVGRLWCGLLCPEGALSEFASDRGRGFALPRWLTWGGWPFVAFALTTIYGQMVSVYQYPGPALVILGGSTGAAILVGYLYGRSKRVWCRYLCPVTGVFGLLSKLAPLHFRVDQKAWSEWEKPADHNMPTVNCAPLVPIRTMKGASDCHMCGRCSGFRGAVSLSRRSPAHEIVHVAGIIPKPWETALIVFGLMGIAAGAFHWTSSDAYIAVKQALAEFLVAHDWIWPLEPHLPWWMLTNYPELNDSLSPLDGAVLVGYIVATSLLIGTVSCLCLAAAASSLGPFKARRFHHFAQTLIPIAGCGVFLGLSALTVTMLRAEGLALDFVGFLRAALLAGAFFWSAWLAWQVAGLYAHTRLRRVVATLAAAGAAGVGAASWALLFWPI
ncbi:MAG: 4Fe-4S binding protein [Beijerinckiaceae bacterium]|nr:4Fe-4S binding protein [Beijerinckiaceae bacterium]